MAVSQNGWTVVPDSQRAEKITDPAVLGVEFPNGWRKGDVDVVFRYLIGRLHREVEPIDNGGCWGYFVKTIEGSTSISNHASGTAIDYNAPAHPMGTRNTYGAADRVKIRAILADLSHVVRWGGDYSGRPDDMHFEINATGAAVARVADWIREGDDVTKDEVKAALREVMPDLLTAWAKTGEGRAALASAVATADDVVSLVPGGPVDSGLQSLIRWPGGHAGAARTAAEHAEDLAEQILAKLPEMTDRILERLPEVPAPGE